MARIDNLSNFLTDIADSIRSKKGTTNKLSPENFDTEIEGIETGDGSSLVTTHFTIDDFTQISSNYTFENDEMICTVPASGVWGGVRLNEPQNGDYHLKLTNNATKGQRIWYMYKEDDTYMYVLCIGSGDGQEGIRYKLSKTTRGTSKIDKLTFPYTPKLNDVLNINVSGSSQTITCNGYTIVTLSDCDTIGASIGDNADNAVPFSVFSEFYRVSKKQIKIQTKELTITENGTQSVIPDEGYDGLEKIDIITNVPSGGGDISEYWDSTIKTDTYIRAVASWINSIKKLPNDITISGISAKKLFYGIPFTEIPLFDTSNITNMEEMFYSSDIVEVPLLDTSNVNSMGSMFYGCRSLKIIPLLDTQNVTNMAGMFNTCTSLEFIPQLNTSNVTTMYEMFMQCSKLTTIPLFNTNKVNDMREMFLRCSSLETVPSLDTSNVTSMIQMFNGCNKITKIPQFNMENVENIQYMFMDCAKLETIPELNLNKVFNISGAFNRCANLTNLGGLINFGQALQTTVSANNGNWKIYLANSNKLTHDSLMNVINGLYDIATAGCNTQQLTLGSNNIAKLTAEEIAIATNKGWSVVS